MKIIAVCNSGFGHSFIIAMNIKKVLKKLNKEAEIESLNVNTINEIDNVDLFVIEKCVAEQTQLPHKNFIIINNVININEITEKLVLFFKHSN